MGAGVECSSEGWPFQWTMCDPLPWGHGAYPKQIRKPRPRRPAFSTGEGAKGLPAVAVCWPGLLRLSGVAPESRSSAPSSATGLPLLGMDMILRARRTEAAVEVIGPSLGVTPAKLT